MNYRIYWMISLFIFGFSQYGNSQLDSTQYITTHFLKEYIPPNFIYQSLAIYPSFRESIVRSDNLDRDRIIGSVYSSFNRFTQKDRSDGSVTFWFSSDFVSDKKNEVKNPNDNYFDLDLNASGFEKFYFSGQAYLKAEFDLLSDNRFYRLEENENDYNQDFTLPISIGFGRYYRVDDAWLAMSMFNDLECHGVYSDRSKLKEVSDLTSTLRNTRGLDNRLRLIENRTKLLDYLNNNHIVPLTPLTASVVHDSYRYERFIQRLSGFSIGAGVAPSINRMIIGISGQDPFITNTFSLEPFIEFEYYHPISEDWQLDFSSETKYSSKINSELPNNFESVSQMTVSWLPNLRTKASGTILYSNFSDELIFKRSNIALDLGINYYISPQIRWSGGIYISNTWQEVNLEKSTTFNQVLSGSLTYFIF